eukprot:1664739-Alexandrium_andersonii.AAC.1
MGLPRQSTSAAGRGRVGADPRDLRSTAVQLIREVRPPAVVFEVVPGFSGRAHTETASSERFTGPRTQSSSCLLYTSPSPRD